jgi:hypothetical protein
VSVPRRRALRVTAGVRVTSGAIGTVHHRSRDPDPRQRPITFGVKQIQLLVKYVFRVSFNVRNNVSVPAAPRGSRHGRAARPRPPSKRSTSRSH